MKRGAIIEADATAKKGKYRDPREGDWECPSCEEYNFAMRTHCRKCHQTKDGTGEPSKPVFAGKGASYHDAWPDDWECLNCGDHNFARRAHCRKCKFPKTTSKIGEEETNPDVKPDNWKNGDWKCTACGEHNFASRTFCRMCNKPKGAPSNKFGGEESLPHPENWKPGDWICGNCGDHQFASRMVCRQCGAPRQCGGMGRFGMPQPGGMPGGLGPPGMPADFKNGDWICPNCGDHQFASRTQCRKCGTPKPEGGPFDNPPFPPAPWPPAGNPMGMENYGNRWGPPRNGFGGYGGGQRMGASGQEWKNGDWSCPQCGDHNFASRTECRQCGAKNPGNGFNGPFSGHPNGAQSTQSWKRGDWNCPECNEHNFASRTNCRQCNVVKPESEN